MRVRSAADFGAVALAFSEHVYGERRGEPFMLELESGVYSSSLTLDSQDNPVDIRVTGAGDVWFENANLVISGKAVTVEQVGFQGRSFSYLLNLGGTRSVKANGIRFSSAVAAPAQRNGHARGALANVEATAPSAVIQLADWQINESGHEQLPLVYLWGPSQGLGGEIRIERMSVRGVRGVAFAKIGAISSLVASESVFELPTGAVLFEVHSALSPVILRESTVRLDAAELFCRGAEIRVENVGWVNPPSGMVLTEGVHPLVTPP